jgi:DNA polymerase III subunit delta
MATTKESGGGVKPVYAVYGPDEFLRRQAIARIVRETLGKEPPPMAMTEVEGPKAMLAEVLDDLRTLPFLADRRLLIVQDADAFITAHREALERYVAAPSATGVLVLVCDVMNRQWRLAKAILEVGSLVECKAPPPRERSRWLTSRASQEYGKKLPPSAAEALLELVGTDMASLDGELAKLAIYVGDRDSIEAADVDDLVGFTRPENIFRMTDALAERNADACFRIWRQTLATDKEAAFRAIGGLAWAVRQLMAAKDPGRSNVNPYTARSAARFSLPQLNDMLLQLLAADLASKTGLGTVESAVEKLVVKFCMTG